MVISTQKIADKHHCVQSIYQLPNDLKIIVSRIYLKIIDVVSEIQAFFSTLFYGNISSWKGFWKNVDKKFIEISNKKRYQKLQNTRYATYVEHKINDEKKTAFLKKIKGNLNQYSEFKINFSQEQMQKLMPFLEKFSENDISNILIDLNTFLSKKDIPKDVKALIDDKLNQIPQYRILKMKLKRKIMEREQLKLQRYNLIKKIALITAIFMTTTGFALYYNWDVLFWKTPFKQQNSIFNAVGFEKLKNAFGFIRRSCNEAGGVNFFDVSFKKDFFQQNSIFNAVGFEKLKNAFEFIRRSCNEAGGI